MPKLTKEEALILAQSKFGTVLEVGTYDKVMYEAQKRANARGGAWFSIVRIDGAEYNDEYKRLEMIEDPAVGESGLFWFALLPACDPYKEK